MFIVIEIIGRELGKVHTNLNWDQALDLATKIVMEQCDESEEDIRAEFENDNDYWYGATAEEGFTVYIAQAEGKE